MSHSFTEVRIDTDEANAAGIRTEGEGSVAPEHVARPVAAQG